jgi:putative two-component system response regulator
VQEQVAAIVESHLATIFALAKLAEYRDDDTGKHIQRVQSYCEVLARRLCRYAAFHKYVDAAYTRNLVQTAALHDIGKVGIPDPILLKPGPLTDHERAVIQTHTTIGAKTLEEVLQCHPENRFIKMGVSIARSHHEKFDGAGYPHRLQGDNIPLSARILTIADHYDALRNERPYKTAWDHRTACDIILEGDDRTSPSHFDPIILRAFKESQAEFAQVFDHFRDSAAGVDRRPA